MSPSRWSAYRPSPSAPWYLARAWTLRRRAGFAATWDELQRDLESGPDAAVDRVLDGTGRIQGILAEFATTADLLGDASASGGDIRRLQAWWLFRMLFTPDPLAERLALVWHNHFATSQLKVDDVDAMRRQNETFRCHARGLFGDLLRAMLRDPALLVWLDAPSNRKGKPNENLARELMELFTLGVGQFSERDVKEVARALTGRTVVQGRYAVRPDSHDDAPKTILGKKNQFDGDKLADILLQHPATARRLAWRLCQTFLGENVADESAVSELAERLRADGLHVGRAVEMILRSERFFSARNLHAQVSEPVALVIGTVRSLERFDPPPSTLLLAEWTGRLGQELLFPPNVGGWPGGRSWLSGRSVVARANYAAALVGGRLNAGSAADVPDLRSLAARHGRGKDAGDALRFFGDLALGRSIEATTCRTILEKSASEGASDAERLNRAVALMLSRPEAQLT
jgi:uncharacterized protein (DUF1800 family)